MECIGKGKAHKPYEFGVKVSLATTVSASKGGQFVLHAKALPGNPYDGHTLKTVLPGIEAMTGATLSRILADAGYKGHNAPKEHKFKVYTQGQKRGVTDAIKRQLKRRAAVEPVIGHCKDDHRMGRNFLAHREGDAINAVLAACFAPADARRCVRRVWPSRRRPDRLSGRNGCRHFTSHRPQEAREFTRTAVIATVDFFPLRSKSDNVC